LKIVDIDHIQPGMIVARPIFGADSQVLLASGTPIKPEFITQLRRRGVPCVYVVDERFPDIEAKDVVSPETRVEAMFTAKEVLNEVKERAKSGLGRLTGTEARKVKDQVNGIIDELIENRDLVVNLTDIRAADDYTFGHSVNVCILSLMTAIGLGYEQMRLRELGVGAILHDIGKTKIPEEVLNKPSVLTPAEFEEVKKHPAYGFEIIRRQDGLSSLSAHVAYQHHERSNGEGYPRKLMGTEIHEFARIAAVADVYDALVADRVYRRGFLPADALDIIAGNAGRLFDRRIAKAFTENIAPYPVGSLIQLTTKEVAVVIKVRRAYPRHPVLRVIKDGHGHPVAKTYDLDLTQHRDVHVARAIDERGPLDAKDVRQLI
jgi:HD-GYP domain-containing protein (c-di-GMP phosphodiesterase class II)